MIKDANTDFIPPLLSNLALSQVSTQEDFDHFDNNEYLVKFFSLLQMANEMQANQMKLMFSELKDSEAEYAQIHEEIDLHEKKMQDKQSKINSNKNKAQEKSRVLT